MKITIQSLINDFENPTAKIDKKSKPEIIVIVFLSPSLSRIKPQKGSEVNFPRKNMPEIILTYFPVWSFSVGLRMLRLTKRSNQIAFCIVKIIDWIPKRDEWMKILKYVGSGYSLF